MTLRDQLAETEAQAERLRRQIAAASCREAGCDMKHSGGMNAGCGPDCSCSVPVHTCIRCGDSDYGDNPEADETRRTCAEMNDGPPCTCPGDDEFGHAVGCPRGEAGRKR